MRRYNPLSYAGYRFPPDVISYAVWLYYRFPLNLRMVEELLAPDTHSKFHHECQNTCFRRRACFDLGRAGRIVRSTIERACHPRSGARRARPAPEGWLSCGRRRPDYLNPVVGARQAKAFLWTGAAPLAPTVALPRSLRRSVARPVPNSMIACRRPKKHSERAVNSWISTSASDAAGPLLPGGVSSHLAER
jgi:hypothetical protein